MDSKYRLIVLPDNKRGIFSRRISLYQAIQSLGISLNSTCGGIGRCGKCRVQIKKGYRSPGKIEREFLSDNEIKMGYRLACRRRINADMEIYIPPESRRFVSKTALLKPSEISLNPRVKKRFIELPACKPLYSQSSFDIIKEKMGVMPRPPLKLLRENLPISATFVTYRDDIIAIEEGDTTSKCYGIAVDIGTAIISALLVDLTNGSVISEGALLNPQVIYGTDIISRIDHASKPGGLLDLQKTTIEGVDLIIRQLLKRSGVDIKNIYEAVFVGNPCMHHLFLGIPPDSLARAPFKPVFRDPLYISSNDILLESLSDTRCYVFPNIGGFVGGDTVGAILVSGMLRSQKNILLIDIGTNGEIVLGSRGRALSVSCAAGPAFEGVNISCGMPATVGAIEHINVKGENLLMSVIDGGEPWGICGSGIIDAHAQLLRLGIIERNGRLKKTEKTIITKDGIAFPLTKNIYLSQKDIRQFQLAKAAIRAGIEILKKQMEIDYGEIERVLIAGSFGNSLRRESLVEIGLLPEDLSKKTNFIGNAALEGARLALLSEVKRKEAETIPDKVKYIELMSREDFQQGFVDALKF